MLNVSPVNAQLTSLIYSVYIVLHQKITKKNETRNAWQSLACSEEMYTFHPLELQSYWTEFHQILHDVVRSYQLDQITRAILQFVSERQCDEYR